MATKKKKATPKPKAKAPAAKGPKLRPLGDRILVKRLEADDVVRGGIIIPDSAKEKPQEGIVVALGEGRKTRSGKVLPFDVKVGDRVMIEKYTGSDVTLEGDEYTIIHALLGVAAQDMVKRIDEPAVLIDEMQNTADIDLFQGVEKRMIHWLSPVRIPQRPATILTALFDLEMLILARGDPPVDAGNKHFELLFKLG